MGCGSMQERKEWPMSEPWMVFWRLTVVRVALPFAHSQNLGGIWPISPVVSMPLCGCVSDDGESKE